MVSKCKSDCQILYISRVRCGSIVHELGELLVKRTALQQLMCERPEDILLRW